MKLKSIFYSPDPFSSCTLLIKEAKKVRPLYIFCEKKIYNIDDFALRIGRLLCEKKKLKTDL